MALYAPFGASMKGPRSSAAKCIRSIPCPGAQDNDCLYFGPLRPLSSGRGAGRARLRAAPPRGFEKVSGSLPRQAAPALVSSRAQPRALICPTSLFVRMLPAGVQPGLGQSNRSPPAADSPPCPRRSVSRIRRCPGCTCATTRTAPDRRCMLFIPLSPSAAYVAQNPNAVTSGAPGFHHGDIV